MEILAAITGARRHRGHTMPWDARLETSAIAVLEYLWRRGRGEEWAGRAGSALYACSLRQLVLGLAPIMGWRDVPVLSRDPNVGVEVRRRRYEQQVARFVKRHRKSLQRWLDWLELAGLISHTPQQDEEGFWWRTVIELRAPPEVAAELLQEAIDRRAGWLARERRREARGRGRNLTAILRRARLSRAQRRARAIQRRAELNRQAERQRVRELVAESLAQVAKTHLTHPYGASTTSRNSLESVSQDEAFNRGLTGARTCLLMAGTPASTSTTGDGREEPRSGEKLRWTVYNEVMAARFASPDDAWPVHLAAGARRVAQLVGWDDAKLCPRWRLIEAWTIVAHGPQMAAAGGFRLAFWREEAEHHGPRLERALARYRRYADVRPPGFPPGAIAAFAHFLGEHTARQDGPRHGMAYDVQRFNELTKRMSAYAHYTRPAELERAAARARRRDRARQLAEQVNTRLNFRTAGAAPAARLRLARELLDSDYAAHRQAGRVLYAAAQREARLQERDEQLMAGRHPGGADSRYRAACAHAARWGLPTPAA